MIIVVLVGDLANQFTFLGFIFKSYLLSLNAQVCSKG